MIDDLSLSTETGLPWLYESVIARLTVHCRLHLIRNLFLLFFFKAESGVTATVAKMSLTPSFTAATFWDHLFFLSQSAVVFLFFFSFCRLFQNLQVQVNFSLVWWKHAHPWELVWATASGQGVLLPVWAAQHDTMEGRHISDLSTSSTDAELQPAHTHAWPWTHQLCSQWSTFHFLSVAPAANWLELIGL